MNLTRIYRKITKQPLKIYWWRYEYPAKLNFGDELTPILIEKIFNLKTEWAEPKDCDLIGAGSIIEVVQALAGDNKIHVWGSGFIKPGEHNDKKNLIFSAVRGLQSLERIDNKHAALGDPALLCSVAFKNFSEAPKKFKIGIIPHYVDAGSPYLKNIRTRHDVLTIDPLQPVEKVVADITSCELILSSTLHGLITSDSFDIPNYWLPLSDKLTGGEYKFNDYYSVFGLKPQPLDPSQIDSIDTEQLINDFKPKENLKELQDKLIAAFPY